MSVAVLSLLLFAIWMFARLSRNRAHLNKALQDIEFQRFAINQHAIISATDLDGNITFVNDRFCIISGHSQEFLLGKNHRVIKSDEHQPELYRNMWQTITNGNVWHGTVKNIRKNGTDYWVEATIVPQLNKAGKPIGYFSIRTDITEQKALGQALKAKQDFLLQVTDSLGQGVYAQDTVGHCTFINAKAAKLLGWNKEELLGMPLHEIIHHHGSEDKTTTDAMICPVMVSSYRGDNYASEDEFLVKRDGTLLPVSLTASPMMQNGKYAGTVVTFDDITERKQILKELHLARQVADTANEAKSLFLANMSHEIRTPMNAIIGLSHLCLNTKLDAQQHYYVNKVHKAGVSMLGIINGILDFSKIEANKMDIEEIEFSLEEVLSNVTSIVAQKADEKRLELLLHPPTGIPDTLIGDPLRLGQVITNLVNNAVKFTQEGEVNIFIEALESTSNKIKLRFSVTDTGIGMTSEQISRLFTSFTQADGSTSRRFGGTGLGLSISKRLVELMGGEIGVKSTVDTGSTFFFTLWLGIGNGAETGATKQETSSINYLDGRRFMIADGRDSSAEIMQELLMPLPVTSDRAKNEAEVMAKLSEARQTGKPYDLVILGFVVSGYPGIDLAQAIRNIYDTPCKMMLVISVTDASHLSEEERQMMDSILLKPVDSSNLLGHLAKLFQKEKSISEENTLNNQLILSGMRILLTADDDLNQHVIIELLTSVGAIIDVANNEKIALSKLDASPDGYDAILLDLQIRGLDIHETIASIRQDKRWSKLTIITMSYDLTIEELQSYLAEGIDDNIIKPIKPDMLLEILKRWRPRTAKAFPAPSPSPHPQTSTDNFTSPAIDGLNFAKGVKNAGNDFNLYQRILQQFHQEQEAAIAQIGYLIKERDLTVAARMAHSLKGSAATIGANSLSAAAATLEKKLHNNADFEDTQTALDLVISIWHPLTKELAQYFANTSINDPHVPSDISLPTEEARMVISRLSALIDSGDGEAEDMLLEHKETLTTLLKHQFAPLNRAVQNFDFDTAKAILAKIVLPK